MIWTKRIALVFEQIARYLLLATVAALILLAGAGGWAATAQFKGAVIAAGVFKVQSFSKSVQHLEGGLIEETLVKDGDRMFPTTRCCSS